MYLQARGLGLEALSRYALSCDFIELDKSASAQLKEFGVIDG